MFNIILAVIDELSSIVSGHKIYTLSLTQCLWLVVQKYVLSPS